MTSNGEGFTPWGHKCTRCDATVLQPPIEHVEQHFFNPPDTADVVQVPDPFHCMNSSFIARRSRYARAVGRRNSVESGDNRVQIDPIALQFAAVAADNLERVTAPHA